MPVTKVQSKWSSGNLVFYGDGNIDFGVDDDGLDVTMYGATSGCFWRWDESADTVVRDGGSLFVKAVASGDGGITVGSDGMFADPETATEAGYITIDVAGTEYEIPFYASS